MRDEYSNTIEATSKKQEEQADALKQFPIERIGTIEVREPKWLVDGILEEATIGLIFGESGAGKSFIAIDIGLSIAANIPWHSHDVSPGPVIYICGEGRNGVIRRVHAWSIARGVDTKEIPFFITAGALNLSDKQMMNTVRLAIDGITELAGEPRLIILDTWAVNLGGDENSTADSTIAIASFQRLCTSHGSAGIIIHHVGHGDKNRPRGSSALKPAIDMEFRVEQDQDKTIRVIGLKAKDSEQLPPMAFTLQSIALGFFDKENKPYTSAVIQPINYTSQSETSKEPTGKWQIASLSVLETLVSEEYKNNQDAYASLLDVGIPKQIWRKASYEVGVPRTQFYPVSNSLLEANKITIEKGKVFLV